MSSGRAPTRRLGHCAMPSPEQEEGECIRRSTRYATCHSFRRRSDLPTCRRPIAGRSQLGTAPQLAVSESPRRGL